MLEQLQWTDASSVSATLRQWLAGADPASPQWQRVACVAIEVSDASALAVLRASLPASALDAVARARLLLAVARRGALDQVSWGTDLATCLELLDAARDDHRWDATAARAWARLVSRLPTRRAVTTIDRTLARRDAAFIANLYLALREIGEDFGATEEALVERWLEAAPPHGLHRVTLATAAFRMDPPRGGVALRAALKQPPSTIRLEAPEVQRLYADDPAKLHEHAEALRLDPDTLAAVLGEDALLARLEDTVRRATDPGHGRARAAIDARALEILATWPAAAARLDALLDDAAIPPAMHADLRAVWCRLHPERAVAWITARPIDDAREAAAFALLRAHPEPDPALATWALGQDRPRVLLAALREPSPLPDTSPNRARLGELTGASWPDRVRVRAAQRLVTWGDRGAASTLLEITEHDEVRIRRLALRALVDVAPDLGAPTFEAIVARAGTLASTAHHAELRLALHGLARAGDGTRVLQTLLHRDDGAAFTAVLATLSRLPPLDPDPFWDHWPAR